MSKPVSVESVTSASLIPAPRSHAATRVMAFGLIAGLLCFQLTYWPIRWDFNTKYAVLGFPLVLVVVLLAGTGNVRLCLSRRRVLLSACMAFFATALLSTVLSHHVVFSLWRWLAYLGYASVAVSICLLVFRGLVSLDGILAVILAAALVMILAEVRVILDTWAIYSHLAPGHIYYPAYFNHIRNLAHVPTAGLAAASYFCWRQGASRWQRGLSWLLMAFFLTVLVWAAGRASAVIVPMMWILVALLMRARPIAWLLGSSIGAVILAFALVIVSGNSQMLVNVQSRTVEDFSDVGKVIDDGVGRAPASGRLNTIDNIGSGRLGLWREALDDIAERPVIGSGGGEFLHRHLTPDMRRPNQVPAHPHNWILRMLLEFGVVGTVLLLGVGAITAKITMDGYRRSAHPQAIGALAALALTWLVYGLISGTLYYAWPIITFMFCIGALVGASTATDTDNSIF